MPVFELNDDLKERFLRSGKDIEEAFIDLGIQIGGFLPDEQFQKFQSHTSASPSVDWESDPLGLGVLLIRLGIDDIKDDALIFLSEVAGYASRKLARLSSVFDDLEEWLDDLRYRQDW